MSFGDGNLREKVGDLNRQVDKLQRVNGELCAEINRQERRIRELEELVRDMYAKLLDVGCGIDEIGGMAEHMDALGIEVDA